MELYEAMRTTFAVREYTDDPISDAVLYELIETARFAPSGGNRQGNRVIIVRDPATRARLRAVTEPAARRYWAQSKADEVGFCTVTPSRVSEAEIAATEVPPMLTAPFVEAAVVLVFAVDLKVVSATDKDLDRVGVISGASIYPFVWNVLLAARQHGFGGVIGTLAIAEEPAIKALLNIPDDVAVAAIVPLGRPVKQLTRLRRRPVEEIATREAFDGVPFTLD